jgi:hypothetical protein
VPILPSRRHLAIPAEAITSKHPLVQRAMSVDAGSARTMSSDASADGSSSKARSEVFNFIKERVDRTPGGVNTKTVYVCQTCKANNKDQV